MVLCWSHMTEETRHLNVRMPDSLLAELREAAVADSRSVNSEVVVALREWLALRRAPLKVPTRRQ